MNAPETRTPGSGDPVQIAVVGCGRMGQAHLETASKEPCARLVAVADVDEKTAGRAAEAYHAPAFTDLAAMLASAKPDAVIVSTPPNSHRSITEEALRAGAHVLCEKPFALTVEDAQRMVDAAEAAKRQVMMASKFRYVSDLVKARAIVQAGILGDIILLENEFCSHVDMRPRWNSKREISGGGVLVDNGSHSVDIVRYLLGPIERLQALHGKQWQEIEVEDTCHISAQVSGGAMVSIDLSWSIHKESPWYVSVYGTSGMLQLGWRGSRYRQSQKLDWVEFGTGYEQIKAVKAQLSNFLETICGRAAPLITPDAAVESVRAVEAAYRSAEQNHWQQVSG